MPEVRVDTGDGHLPGTLALPPERRGLVLFAHGSGSSRRSVRNMAVADALNGRGLSTLLFDLLTDAEARDRRNVFDIALLAQRMIGAARWAMGEGELATQPLGFFGASTGAAAALVAAAALGDEVAAVVSRGGRPDLAGPALPEVTAPTLLIVGSLDEVVLDLHRPVMQALKCRHELLVVDGASHLFEEPGTLDHAAAAAGDWFLGCFGERPGPV